MLGEIRMVGHILRVGGNSSVTDEFSYQHGRHWHDGTGMHRKRKELAVTGS